MKKLALLIALLLAAATPAMAQQTEDPKALRLLGKPVEDSAGQNIGRVEDVEIQPEDARAERVIIATTGAAGEAKRVAVPWDKARLDEDNSTVILDMTADDVAALESYEGGGGLPTMTGSGNR